MTITTIPRTSAQARLETMQMAQQFRQMDVGHYVSYAALDALTGLRDVQTTYRYLMDQARAIVFAETGKLFEPTPDHQGLLCLSSSGKVGHLNKQIERQHRAAHRNLKKGHTVNLEELTPLEKHCYLAQQTIFGTLLVVTHPKTLTQLAEGKPPPALPWDAAAHKDAFRRPPA